MQVLLKLIVVNERRNDESNKNCRVSTLLVLCVGIAVGQDAAHDVDKATTKTGHVAKHAVKKVGKTTKTGAEDVGHGAKVAAKDTGKGVKTGTEKIGEGIKDAVAK